MTNAKHTKNDDNLYFRRINKQKQKVMAKEARLNASLNNVPVEESDSDEDPEGKDHPLLIIGKKTKRVGLITVPVT